MSDQLDYTERFADSGLRVFQRAIEESQRRGQNFVSLWHILHALAAEDAASFDRLAGTVGLNARLARELIEAAMTLAPQHAGRGIRIAPEVNSLFHQAREMARLRGRVQVEAADMLLVMAQSVKLWPPWTSTSSN